MGAPSIITGLNTFQPIQCAQTRRGELIVVNGLDRGYIWDRLTAAAEPLGMDPPAAAPTIATPAGGAATAGDYICAYRFIDDNLESPVPSSITDVATVTAADNDKFQWTGLSPRAQTRADQVQLWRGTSGQAVTLYLVGTYGAAGSITSSASAGGFIRFTVPAGHRLIAGCKITVSGSSEATDNATHTISAVTSTTITTTTAYTADGTGGSWVLEGFLEDTASDATLQASTSLNILLPNGDVNARRFVPPPNWKAAVASFQDRTWYAVDVEYTTGTVTTNASTTLTGSGTAWTSAMTGRYIYIAGETTPYEVTYVSATQLTLDRAAATSASGKAYALRPAPSERNKIYYSEVDEPESVPAANSLILQENVNDRDEITALIPHGGQMFVGKDRHLYRLAFVRQPNLDATVSLVAHRGCCNPRCWASHEGVLYLLDEQGPYAFTGGVQPMGEPIRDIFADQVDWTKKKWFFVHVDPVEELVYFHVSYTADSSTRPRRALVWDIRGQKWQADDYVRELGGAAKIGYGSRQRTVVGAEQDQVYLLNQGTLDGTAGSGTVRGTVTASTSTTLTDSGATFPTDCKWATVAIVAGTGKGQIRIISTRNSGTQITVSSAWTTNPDTTSQYVIGAIEWNFKTGLFELLETEKDNVRGARITFEPTANAATLDIRRYLDHASTPDDNARTENFRDGVQTTAGDPDAVVNLKLTQNSLENEPGSKQHRWAGRMQSTRGQSHRWVAVQLRGYQGADAIRVLGLDVYGVRS